jgi:hypothetical protein
MNAAFFAFLLTIFLVGPTVASADALFNLTGSVHGFGDVVGPYLLAAQVAQKSDSSNRVFLLIDERAEKVLKTYLELGDQPLKSEGRFVFVKARDLSTLPPLDRLYETFRGARKAGLSTSEIVSQLKTLPKVTLIAQDLHSAFGRDSLPPFMKVSGWSEVRTSDRTFYFSAAGLGRDRIGVLDDASILPYQNKSLTQQRELAATRFESLGLLSQILRGRIFAKARLSFAYGVHNETFRDGPWRGYPGQLASYVKGLEAIVKKSRRPVLVFSPNSKEILEQAMGPKNERTPSTLVVSLEELKSKPRLSSESVYLVSTGPLSSSQFVALTAASDLPYMIEGDSALSAAVRLAKPFVMLKGPWGLFGIDGLSRALQEAGASWAPSVYPIHEQPGHDTPNFVHLEEIAQDARAFKNLARNAKSWSQQIETILSFAEGKISEESLLKEVRDPLLRASLTSQGNEDVLVLLSFKKRNVSCRTVFTADLKTLRPTQ